MLAKHWKKIGLIILLILILFNVVTKIVSKTPFKDEIESSAYVANEEKTNKTK